MNFSSKKKINLFVFLTIILSILFLTFGYQKSSAKKITNKKTLIVATSPNFPPFENKMLTKNGSTVISGFDIDLLKKLSKDLNFKYKLKETDFSGLIGFLQTDKADLVISGMTATAERSKTVDFSKSYFNAKTVILHSNNIKIKSGKNLKNLKVAAVFNTQYAQQAKKLGAKVTSLDTGTLVAQDLWNGTVQGAMMDQTKAQELLKKHKKYSYYVFKNKELKLSSPNTFSIAFPKGKEQKLQNKINNKINDYKKNGEIKKIAKKWMGKQIADQQ